MTETDIASRQDGIVAPPMPAADPTPVGSYCPPFGRRVPHNEAMACKRMCARKRLALGASDPLNVHQQARAEP